MSQLALVSQRQQNRFYEASGASHSRLAQPKDHGFPSIPKGFNSVSHMRYSHVQTFNVMNLNRDALAQALTGIGSKRIFKYGRLLRAGTSKELFWVVTTHGPSLYFVDWFKHRIDVWSHQLESQVETTMWNTDTCIKPARKTVLALVAYMAGSHLKVLDTYTEFMLKLRQILYERRFRALPQKLERHSAISEAHIHTCSWRSASYYCPKCDRPSQNTLENDLSRQGSTVSTKEPWRYAMYTKTPKVTEALQNKQPLSRLLGEVDPTDAISSVSDTTASEYEIGHRVLASWKNRAGSKKTWRRCERIKTANSTIVVRLWSDGQSFFKSPLWLPQAFLRSQAGPTHNENKKTLRSRAHFEDPKKTFYSSRFDSLDEIVSVPSLCDDPPPPRARRTVERDLQELDSLCLPAAYIRLSWGGGIKPVGKIDRFLPTGLVLQSRWRVVCLLRNDSHADVYVIVNIHDRREPGAQLELHHFLVGYHGNSVTFAKRRQERMCNNRCCLGRFWYGDRRMLILRVLRPEALFQFDPKDFPSLSESASRLARQARCAYRLSNIPTYAVVLRTPRGDPQLPPLYQRLKEEKTRRADEIREKTREERSRKQRDKRNTQRLAMREGRALEDEEPCVASGAYNLT